MSPSEVDPARDSRRTTTGLAIATLLTIVPVTLVVPVLKPLVQDGFGVGDFATSLFMSINMIGAILAAPFAGAVSDRTGRRKSLIVGALLIDAVLLFALAHAPTYGTLMGIRLIEGAAHIVALSLVLAMAADHARAVGSARVMGAVGATLTLGVAIGAPVGGLIGRHGASLPLLAGAAVSLFAALFVVVAVRGGRVATRVRGGGRLLDLLRANRALGVPLTFAFVDRFTVGFFITSFPLYTANVLGLDSGRTGLLMGGFLIPFALLCYPAGRLTDRHSPLLLIGGGSVCYGLGVMFVGLVRPDLLLPLMLYLGVASSVMFVPTLMLAGSLAPRGMKATAMGAFNAAGSLGFLVGPAVAGAVSQLVGSRFGALSGYQTAFIVAGLAEIACVLATLPALRRVRGALLVVPAPSASPVRGDVP